MALEDRDWYREEPSKAWKQRWDPTPRPSRGAMSSRSIRVHGGAWLAIVVSAGLTFATWHWHLLPAIRLGAAPTHAPAASAPIQGNVVHLRPSSKLDAPVQQVTHWWLTDARFGRVDVYVPVGETPRKALTVALAARGYQVVP